MVIKIERGVDPCSHTTLQTNNNPSTPPNKQQTVGVNPELLGRLKPALEKFVAERKIPGAVVMVARCVGVIYVCVCHIRER